MKTKLWLPIKTLVWMSVLLGLGCGENGSGFGGGFTTGPGLFCDPPSQEIPAIYPSVLHMGATLIAPSGYEAAGQTLEVSFGSAVLWASRQLYMSVQDTQYPVGDLELPSDSIPIHEDGRTEVAITCEALGDPENPCSVRFYVSFGVVDDMILGPSYECSIVY